MRASCLVASRHGHSKGLLRRPGPFTRRLCRSNQTRLSKEGIDVSPRSRRFALSHEGTQRGVGRSGRPRTAPRIRFPASSFVRRAVGYACSRKTTRQDVLAAGPATGEPACKSRRFHGHARRLFPGPNSGRTLPLGCWRPNPAACPSPCRPENAKAAPPRIDLPAFAVIGIKVKKAEKQKVKIIPFVQPHSLRRPRPVRAIPAVAASPGAARHPAR